MLHRQVQSRVIAEQHAQLSHATEAASQMAADTQRTLQTLALELDLPSRPSGCSQQLQDQLRTIHLSISGTQAALRVEGNQITCSSLPVLLDSLPLPADSDDRLDGTRLWHQLELAHRPRTVGPTPCSNATSWRY